VCQASRQCLEDAGYSVRVFSNSDVIAQAEQERPKLILVSLMLPDGSGLTLCRRIREHASLARTPIVFLLADEVEEHRILALECGGDDCIVKPFSPRELVARVQAVLRRLSTAEDTQRAELVIDSWAMKLSVRGSEVPTTSLEF